MVHESRKASKEEFEKEVERSIQENQGLLKRLEEEDMKTFCKERTIVGNITKKKLGEQIELSTVLSHITSSGDYESSKSNIRSDTLDQVQIIFLE